MPRYLRILIALALAAQQVAACAILRCSPQPACIADDRLCASLTDESPPTTDACAPRCNTLATCRAGAEESCGDRPTPELHPPACRPAGPLGRGDDSRTPESTLLLVESLPRFPVICCVLTLGPGPASTAATPSQPSLEFDSVGQPLPPPAWHTASPAGSASQRGIARAHERPGPNPPSGRHRRSLLCVRTI